MVQCFFCKSISRIHPNETVKEKHMKVIAENAEGSLPMNHNPRCSGVLTDQRNKKSRELHILQ
jgi:hypothetical protein